MEIFDIVDELGNPTGQTIERKEAHSKGIRHRTAHVWIARKENGKWQLLLQKRSTNKDSFPGCYDTSSAGHIVAGDEPLTSALRELNEELGIKAEENDLIYAGNFKIDYQREFYGKKFYDVEVAFVYVYAKLVDTEALVLQEEEVDAVEWFDVDFIQSHLEPRDRKFCVPLEGFKIIKKWCDLAT